MSNHKKMEVLDLIISVLQIHEKVLDTQIARLERAVNHLAARDPAEEQRRRFHEPI